jgi:hypothetical protein
MTVRVPELLFMMFVVTKMVVCLVNFDPMFIHDELLLVNTTNILPPVIKRIK